MNADSPISVVIPCFNPTPVLHETLESVRAQTHRAVEIILVNDGTDRSESLALLHYVAHGVHRYIEQPNRGLAAARNAGFAAASSEYILPLDADDRIGPTFLDEALACLCSYPEAAFVYPDYRVFGDVQYTERLGEYNLWDLLWRNTFIYASLIRRADWDAAGGYDERMRLGYEDWDFWLRLAERDRFGRRLPRALFHYRKHGRSLLTVAREHHLEIVAHIRASHPALYSWEGRARIKSRWAPAVCVVGPEPSTPQSMTDWHTGHPEHSPAPAILNPALPTDPHAAELAALAVWAGHRTLTLPDGSRVFSRQPHRSASSPLRPLASLSRRLPERLNRHLVNAELDLRHPVRSALRLIPLRAKERINRLAGRPVFDLSFYLRFQPQSVMISDALVAPLRYVPRPPKGRRRIAFLTPHLGPGGAESVLLDVAHSLDRAQSEVFLIATQSRDASWRTRWEEAADHVYDLAFLVPPERLVAAIHSMAVNWEYDVVVIQNSLPAYSALPHLRRDLPGLRVIDWIHAVDPAWDFVSATAPVAQHIDLRTAISQTAADCLRLAGVPENHIRVIRNGIDLDRFLPAPPAAGNTILYAGRLDSVKRPLLLVEIAAELAKLRDDFQFLVAGVGPEAAALHERLGRSGLGSRFRLLGHADDMPAVLAQASVVLIPSAAEGIPLVALEAFATERPVVCANVGAVSEAVTPDCGVLIEPGPGEPARFARALHELLSDPERRTALGRAGRRKVESDYSRAAAQLAYRNLFAEVAAAV